MRHKFRNFYEETAASVFKSTRTSREPQRLLLETCPSAYGRQEVKPMFARAEAVLRSAIKCKREAKVFTVMRAPEPIKRVLGHDARHENSALGFTVM
jgi:hypothetical protein